MYLRSLVAIVVGLVICLIMTGLAATIASARSSMALLDVRVDSALHADYSKDPQGIRFAPVDPEIIEVARDDAERVAPPAEDGSGEEDEIQFVPIFRVDSAPAPSATPSPQPTPSPEPTSTPTPSPTAQPTLPKTPAVSVSPPPAPTQAPTVAPTPTPTVPPTTAPTQTPTPTSTPTPTPTPTPPPTLPPSPTPTPPPTLPPTPTLLPAPSPTPIPTPSSAIFSVNKDFSDRPGTDTTTVSVTLSCASGTVADPNPTNASEASPATFTVTGFTGDPFCAATESPVQAGYASSGPCHAALIAVGQCTITNTLNGTNFLVLKDFVPDNSVSVTVTLTCETGAVTPASASASEAFPAVFTVTGFTGDPNCSSAESPVPAGYVSSGPCNAALVSVSQCTITNKLNSATFTVLKDFVPDSGVSVPVSLSCDTGVAMSAGASVSEASPATFTVTGFTGDPNCTATESPIPVGYASNGPCNGALVSLGTCTITNTLHSATVTVNKDFSDDNVADVTISLVCTSGSVANDDTTASEADPANFTIAGFNTGATCTATESVPAGYTADQSNCLSVAIVHIGNASCTITNTLAPTPTPTPAPGVQTALFAPIADSFIRANVDATNFGTAGELTVDPHQPNRERALIRFDVSNLPVGATIDVATLTLCPTKAQSGATGRIHGAHRALGPWTETGVTWVSQPPVLDPPTGSSLYLGGLDCLNFDVTDDITAMVGGGANFGWLIRDESEGATSAQVTYASRENANAALAPLLTVTFTQ